MGTKLTQKEMADFIAQDKEWREERATKLRKVLADYGFIFDLEMTRDLLTIIAEFIETEG